MVEEENMEHGYLENSICEERSDTLRDFDVVTQDCMYVRKSVEMLVDSESSKPLEIDSCAIMKHI